MNSIVKPLFIFGLAILLMGAAASTSLVYVNTTTRALTGNIVAGNGVTITATGTGAITATVLGSGVSLTNATGLPLTTGVTGTLPVTNGGTGAATLAANAVLVGNGTSALASVAPGTIGNILTSNGTAWASAVPAVSVTSLTGTSGQVTASGSTGAVTLSLPATLTQAQTFSGITTISNATASSTTGNGALTVAGGVGVVGALNVGGTGTFGGAGNSSFVGNVGIGTTVPVAPLQVGAAIGAPATNGNGVIVNAANTTLDSRGGNIQVITTDSSAIDKGGSIGFGGQYNGLSASVEFASIAGRKENSTAGNFSGYLQFVTTADGVAPSEKMRISGSGNLLIGTTTDITGTKGLYIAGTQTSTTPASGALQVAGGAGIVGALNVGGTGTFGGLVTASAGLTYPVAQTMSVTSGTNQRAGNTTLVGGTKTVANTTVTANTIVLATRKTTGGTVGMSVNYSVSAGTSFTISTDNILDTSTFSYFLIEVP